MSGSGIFWVHFGQIYERNPKGFFENVLNVPADQNKINLMGSFWICSWCVQQVNWDQGGGYFSGAPGRYVARLFLNAFKSYPLGVLQANCSKTLKKLSMCLPGKQGSAPGGSSVLLAERLLTIMITSLTDIGIGLPLCFLSLCQDYAQYPLFFSGFSLFFPSPGQSFSPLYHYLPTTNTHSTKSLSLDLIFYLTNHAISGQIIIDHSSTQWPWPNYLIDPSISDANRIGPIWQHPSVVLAMPDYLPGLSPSSTCLQRLYPLPLTNRPKHGLCTMCMAYIQPSPEGIPYPRVLELSLSGSSMQLYYGLLDVFRELFNIPVHGNPLYLSSFNSPIP